MTGRLRHILASLVILSLGSGAPSDAQEPNKASIPIPLRAADTSSPRETLLAFLSNAGTAIEGWQRGELNESERWARRRALRLLDFSTTPHSNSLTVQTNLMVLLKEILDRIPLPPEEQIPGVLEVDSAALTRWSIPGSTIEIHRMAEGPREGEFLFSSATVERLEAYYRQVKHLSGRSGTTAGFYEEFVRSERTTYARERMLRNRLKRVDTSSPRSTFDGFLDSMNRAYRIVMEVDAAVNADPPTMTREDARQADLVASNLLRRALSTLDLSETPSAHREDVGIEAALQLKEILDRTSLPPVDSIPNAEMVKSARAGLTRTPVRAGEPYRWNYPNTEFEIVEIAEGERRGEFLFSAATVDRVADDYEAVRDLPYRRDLGSAGLEYLAPDRSEGFYAYYIRTPGTLVPGASILGVLVESLPPWAHELRSGQTIWQWAALLLLVLVTPLVGLALFGLLATAARRMNPPWQEWLPILAPALMALFIRQVVELSDREVNITGDVLNGVRATGDVAVAVMWVWFAIRVCVAGAESVITSARVRDVSMDANLLRIGARILGFVIGSWILVQAVRGLGLEVLPLLAGLGVGGLAVALAAQRTFANFMGSLILYINRPVRVGDFCRYGNGPEDIGTVEEIGLLSTRVRSLERTLITVPNADFSEFQLENFAARDQRRFKHVIQLVYETTPEQLRYVLVRLRELLLGHPKVTPDPARVRFVGYGAYSKDVEIYAYLDCQEQGEFLAIQEDLLLRIEDIVREAGSSFAFPSQTTYVTPSAAVVDEKRGGEAEARVEKWRSERRLPFPDFTESEREERQNLLEYPPTGSPLPSTPSQGEDADAAESVTDEATLSAKRR